MRRTIARLLLLFALAGCTVPLSDALPPPVIPARPTADDWPDAGAAVLDDVATMAFDIVEREGQPPAIIATVDHRRRLKILSAAGLEHAHVSLPIDGFSTVTRVVARSVSAGGDARAMSVEGLRATALPGLAKTGELKNLVFTVPGATVGGLVEYRYQRVFVDPHFVPVWQLGGPLPVVRAELGIVVDKGLEVDYRFGRGDKTETVLPLRRKLEDGRERLVFVEREIPATYPEPNMPHQGRLGPWIAVVLSKARLPHNRKQPLRLQTWADVAERLREFQTRVGGEPLAGRAEARFRRVRDTLRPLDLPGLGLRQPVPAAGLERGEPACTRDAAAYLLAALEGSGAKAFPAYVTAPTGPAAPEDLPGLYPFIRAVVAVDVLDDIAKDPSCRTDPIRQSLICAVEPDSYAFLDPLCSGCRYGELPTELTGGRALVLLDKGPRWVDVPEDLPQRNRVMTQLQLTLEIDGTITGGISGELTGAPARRLRRVLGEARRGDERDKALTLAVVGEGSPVRFIGATYQNAKNVDRPLRFRARLKSQIEKVAYNSFILRPADIAGPAMPGDWRTTRRYAAVLAAPAWVETVVQVDLPVGYHVEAKDMATKVESFAEYAAGFARRERTLTYSRRLVLKQQVIPADLWPSFRRFVDDVVAVEEAGVQVRVGG